MTRVWLNDVHTSLNATLVGGVLRPTSTPQIQALVKAANRSALTISIAGGRHAMGGQQFCTNSLHIDMSSMDQILHLDRERGLVRVQAGIQWPALIAGLRRLQRRDTNPWTIIQKQTGANRLSLGGAVAANIHGRQIAHPPISADVESITLVDAHGDARRCSRKDGARLFSLALGGYGLFGVVTEVELRLARLVRLERVVETITTSEFVARMRERHEAGYVFGDLQFATDENASGFLRTGVFSCYRPTRNATNGRKNRSLSGRDWQALALLAHTSPSRAYARYRDHYLATSGQVYDSDVHQLSPYLDDYHQRLEASMAARERGCEVISEFFVPRLLLEAFLTGARQIIRRRGVRVIYGTIRQIERDDEAMLPWATKPWACVVINLHSDHNPRALRATANAFRALIDEVLVHRGSYYLTYHRWATRDQALAAHPRFPAFLAAKLEHDSNEIFQSSWYRHHKALLA